MRPTIHLVPVDCTCGGSFTQDGEVPNSALIPRNAQDRAPGGLAEHLECKGSTQPAQLLYYDIAGPGGAERIKRATRGTKGKVVALLDPYNREGSTAHTAQHQSGPLRDWR
jgi:type III restriction enzyme